MATEVEFHEAANIFPLDEEHLDGLAEDIRDRGQLVPIERLGGKILDGRRRYLACRRAGTKPVFRDVEVADTVAYVLSLNLQRRHLTPSQLAMVAGRAREWYDRLAKERQKASGGDQRHGRKTVPVNLPEPIKGDARDQAAKAVGVSGKSVDYATRVLNRAVPEVIRAVDEGRMAVSTAAILAAEPEEVQKHEAEFNSRGRRKTRRYRPGPAAHADADEADDGHEADRDRNGDSPSPEVRGKGVTLAHQAIDCLSRIPKDDALRKRGFQIVTDWLRRNQ